jgi:2-keto-4-pentenoate hydratase
MNQGANPPVDRELQLASMLVKARGTGALLASPPLALVPLDLDGAFRVQHAVVAEAGGKIAGWKVGAKSPDGPVQGSPLPAAAVRPSPDTVLRRDHPILGLELEIAFRLGREFPASAVAYDPGAVLASIAQLGAAVEIVSSRFADWPKIDKLLQLADLQNHGALIVGEMVRYRPDFAFIAPRARLRFGSQDVFNAVTSNPAGDPRRLLAWVVNHCCARGLSVTPDMVLTTGSYTGMLHPTGGGPVVGKIDGLPEVRLLIQ